MCILYLDQGKRSTEVAGLTFAMNAFIFQIVARVAARGAQIHKDKKQVCAEYLPYHKFDLQYT